MIYENPIILKNWKEAVVRQNCITKNITINIIFSKFKILPNKDNVFFS